MGKRRNNGGCESCIYHGYAAGQVVCEYILHTKRRRPCPAEPGCAVYVKIGSAGKQKCATDVSPEYKWGSEKVKKRSWDAERARQLYEEGWSDEKIAQEVGTTRAAIATWRSRSGLPWKGEAKPKKREKPAERAEETGCAAEEATPPVCEDPAGEIRERHEAEPEETPASPRVTLVRLELSLPGCEVGIVAEGLQAAVEGCAAALGMLRGGEVHGNT